LYYLLNIIPKMSDQSVSTIDGVNTMDIYQLFPLTEPDSIRLMLLLPAEDEDDEVQFLPDSTTLGKISECASETSYTVLSYYTNTSLATTTVFLGTQEVSVCSNLHSALVNLRRKDTALCLWIPALSINPSSISEKNHQIRQIPNILAAASDTIVYLGTGYGNTFDSAWNFLERHSAWGLNAAGDIDHSIPFLRDSALSFRGDLSDVQNAVLSSQWFTRAWSLPEIVVCKNISIQSSRRRVPFHDFCSLLLNTKRPRDPYGFYARSEGLLQTLKTALAMRYTYHTHHGTPDFLPQWLRADARLHGETLALSRLLWRAGTMGAGSDPRDRAFALVGIAADVDAAEARALIEYSRPADHVFKDLVGVVVDADGSYDVLSHLDWAASPGYAGQPPWEARWDWTHEGRTVVESLREDTAPEAQRRRDVVQQNHFWARSQDALVCAGVVVGELVAASRPPFCGSGAAEEHVLRTVEVLLRGVEWEYVEWEEDTFAVWLNIPGRGMVKVYEHNMPETGGSEAGSEDESEEESEGENEEEEKEKEDRQGQYEGRKEHQGHCEDHHSANNAKRLIIAVSPTFLTSWTRISGKFLGLVKHSHDDMTQYSLAIIPSHVPGAWLMEKCLVASFAGGRVPFLVKRMHMEDEHAALKEEVDGRLPRCKRARMVHCAVMGECLVDGEGACGEGEGDEDGGSDEFREREYEEVGFVVH
jgi:hypothetical protein